MIKKGDKLSRKDFKILKKPNSLVRINVLTAKVFTSPYVKKNLFSFSISKKVEKKAVLRNRAKRMGFFGFKKAP